MSFGKWLAEMIGGDPVQQPIPIRAVTRQQLMAQAARQQIDRQMRDVPGAQSRTDVMRRMMGGK